MHYWPPSAPRSRIGAAALTLAAHVLFVLLVLFEKHMEPREQAVARRPSGMWIHLPPLETRPEPAPTRAPTQESPAVPRREAPPQRQPPTAITLPTSPEAPAQEATGTAQPRIDWLAAATRPAAIAAEAKQEGFSPPPEKMREPCKPEKSSFKWMTKISEEKEEDKPPSWTAGMGPPPGSVMMGGTRVGVVGIGITSGAFTLGWEEPEPDKHYFDDMKAGKTLGSSVPDPNICD